MSWARDVWPSERARLMSAHMQPIERLAAEATVEIVELNSWLDDDVKCESPHEGRPGECTVAVTHMAISCVDRAKVCTGLVIYKTTFVLLAGTCVDCGRPAADCWIYRPI